MWKPLCVSKEASEVSNLLLYNECALIHPPPLPPQAYVATFLAFAGDHQGASCEHVFVAKDTRSSYYGPLKVNSFRAFVYFILHTTLDLTINE
jgi:hypothetical protein